MGIVVLLLLAAVGLGIVGLVVRALAWLLAVAAVLILVGVIVGMWVRRRMHA